MTWSELEFAAGGNCHDHYDIGVKVVPVLDHFLALYADFVQSAVSTWSVEIVTFFFLIWHYFSGKKHKIFQQNRKKLYQKKKIDFTTKKNNFSLNRNQKKQNFINQSLQTQ